MHKAVERLSAVSETNQRSRKNKHKWCRGKIGVEHTPSWKVWTQLAGIFKEKPLLFSCDSCGRHLGSWFPHRFSRRPAPEIGSRHAT